MTDTMIFLPAFWLMFLTLALFYFMFKVRVKLLKQGEAQASEFRTYEAEHTESRKWSRAIANQFETPVIFYALTLIAFVTSSVDVVMLTLAWVFVLIKTVHIYVHVSNNRLRRRQPIFALSYFVLFLMLFWTAYRVVFA